MPQPAKIDPAEAFAFLGVVAPRLEQLRRRFVVANNHLKSGDPEAARISAILESQLAIKEFMAGLTDLSELVEPIDIVLDAVREEPAAPITAAEAEPALEPPAPERAVALEPAAASARTKLDQPPPVDAWLKIGTALALERLMAAGMSAAGAEFHLEDVYATVGLKQVDGSPISEDTIREWRSQFGARQGSWRTAALKRRAGAPKGAAAIADAKLRVNDMAGTFMRMVQRARRG